MIMALVLWNLAKTPDGRIVWINEDYNGELCCVECGGQMIAVKGEVKQHHFRHTAESNCSGESARHWSKKYQIHEILERFGVSEVEKGISIYGLQYIADVRFEREWAFEVVTSNPPSEDKFENLKERLVIFDFRDENWENDNLFCGQTLDEIVEQIAKGILQENTEDREFPVCKSCRTVKGEYSRIKHGEICMPCDIWGHIP
jgi:hypothetical protein